MSVAALRSANAAAMQLQRVSSGRDACCRSTCPPAARCTAGWQQRQQRQPRGCPTRLEAGPSSQQQQQLSGGSSRARRRRPLPARAAAEAAEAAEEVDAEEVDAELLPGRPGYRSFQLEGAEFLIAETSDGKLDLQDSFVSTDVQAASSSSVDSEAGGWRRPEGLGEVTKEVQEYQAVPFYSEFQGDWIGERARKTWVWRYYLVPVVDAESEEERLSFDGIHVLDGKAASLTRCEVHRLAPPDTPSRDLRLRIRDDVVTIDTIESLPDWEHAVRARLNAVPALSQLEVQRLAEYMGALEEARQMGTIDEAELEMAYDVHWLAGMQAGGAGVQALGNWEGSQRGVGGLDEEGLVAEPAEDAMGGWDEGMLKDLMDFNDEENEEAEEYDEFDSPAADY